LTTSPGYGATADVHIASLDSAEDSSHRLDPTGSDFMLRAKDWVLIVGVIVATLGYEFLPHGQELNAKLNTSAFAQLAGAGAFTSAGGITLVAGLMIILVAAFIPKKL
jgi:hypothetical protein